MRFKNQVGDTIIEVLISTTVLALVLSVSFISATRSLQSGTDAANRNQAVSYAQQQVELIRQAANNGSLANFQINQPFCIDPSNGTKNTSVDSNQVCHIASQAPFGVGVSYSSLNQTFTVTVKWEGVNNNSNFNVANNSSLNQVVIYYQYPQ